MKNPKPQKPCASCQKHARVPEYFYCAACLAAFRLLYT